ncbi:MAG: sialidase family protein [Patescibacteria group bacterium]
MKNKLSILSSIIFLTVFCLIGFSQPIQAASTTEQTATASNLGLYGSHTWDIAVDPNDSNYVYIATYYSPNGFFRSSDGGLTWSGLPNSADHGSGRAVEVDPATGHVFALLGDLLVSTDHGATYTVAADFSASGTDMLYTQAALFVAADDAVMRSTDEGVNFSTATVCADESIRALASSDTALYALCYNYSTEVSTVYSSSDEGDTWTDMNVIASGVSGTENIAVNPITTDIFLLPSSTGGNTYRSSDAGVSWTTLATAPVTSHMTFDSTGRIYVGWNYSDDNGDTWTQFIDRGDYNHIVMPDPTNDLILYDTTAPGFEKSTDGGITWTSSVTGITGVEVTSISQTADKALVWVATQNGLAKTANFTDAAPTWEYPITPTANFVSSSYDSVWVNPVDPNIVVTSTSQDLYYSSDGGTTWTEATVDLTLTGAVFQIVGDDTGVIYATVGPNTSAGDQTGGVISSSDNGVTWQSLQFPNTGAAYAIALASDGDIFVGAHATVGGIYKYDGTTWTKLSAPDEYEYRSVIVNPEQPDTIYALATIWPRGDAMGFYRSTDDGVTWEHITTGITVADGLYEFNALALQTSTQPATLYLSGVQNSTLQGIVFKSSDGGTTWNVYYTGKRGETFKVLLFDGLTAGNTRGLYDMKSYATATLRTTKTIITRGQHATLALSLKDATTQKRLKHRRVTIKRLIAGGHWTNLKTVETNARGKASISVLVTKTARYKAVFTPKRSADQAEYTVSQSERLKIKVRP